ncbi:hypothetical protein P9112_000500 [Eukaryota sp. TZLM1-RC]
MGSHPKLNLEKAQLVDFGRVACFSKSTYDLHLTNSGGSQAEVSFSVTQSLVNLAISPSSISIPPGSDQTITLTLQAREKGIFKAFVQVTTKSNSGYFSQTTLDVNALVVGTKLSFHSPSSGQQLSELSFDRSIPIFFGESVSFTVPLFNDTPSRASFNIVHDRAPDCLEESILTADVIDYLSVSPKTGQLSPLEKSEITFSINPQVSQSIMSMIQRLIMRNEVASVINSNGFRIKFMINVNCDPKKSSFNLFLNLDFIFPVVSCSQYEIFFPETGVNKKNSVPVTLTNQNNQDVAVSFDKIAHFCINPSQSILKPNTRATFICTFNPKRSGKISGKVFLNIGKSSKFLLKLLPITLSGSSYLSKNNQSINLTKTNNSEEIYKLNTIKKPLFKTDPSILDPLNPYQLDVEEMEGNYEHRTQYIKHLREQRVKKAQKARDIERKRFENAVDLGIKPDDSFPHLKPLPLTESVEFGSKRKDLREAALVNRYLDSSIYIEKKFPPPSKIESSGLRYLDEDELSLVITSQLELDFGRLTIGSKGVKYFNIYNGTDSAISVKIDVTGHDLIDCHQSTRHPQLVPAKSVAGFSVVLNSANFNKIEQFSSNVNVIINNQAVFQFSIMGEIVPVTVNAVPDLIGFDLTHDDPENLGKSTEEKCEEIFALANPGNLNLDFKLMQKPSFLIISPTYGSISAFNSTKIKAVFIPDENLSYSDSVVFKITNDYTIKVDIVAKIPEGKLVTSSTVRKGLDFGLCLAGDSVTKSFLIKNVGKFDSFFRIHSKLLSKADFTISPSSGLIKAAGEAEVSIKLAPSVQSESSRLSHVFELLCSGQPKIKIHCKAKVDVAKIKVNPDSIIFDRVFVGQTGHVTVDVSNLSECSTDVLLDFSDYPAFDVDFSKSTPNSILYHKPPINQKLIDSSPSQKQPSISNRRAYLLRLSSLASNKVCLSYSPKKVEELTFEIPLSFPSFNFDCDCQFSIKSTSSLGRLLLTSDYINFGSKAIITEEMPDPLSLYQSNLLVSSSEMFNTINFKIKSPKDSPFRCLSPPGLSISPQDKVDLQFSFCPKSIGHFSDQFELISDNGEHYIVKVTGNATSPCIMFSQDRIVFPPSPLGVELTTLLTLTAVGIPSTTLEARLPPDETRIPITVDFLNGNSLGFNNPSLSVLVKVKSDYSLSFVGCIDFITDSGIKFSITCCGIFDNSFLTLSPSLKLNENYFQNILNSSKNNGSYNSGSINFDFPSINTCGGQGVNNSDYLVSLGNFPPFEPLPIPSLNEIISNSNQNLVFSFLSTFIFDKSAPKCFADFFSNNCRCFKLLVEKVIGKQCNQLKITSNNKDQTQILLNFTQTALKLLKSRGLLLNTVRATYLLPREQFIELLLEEYQYFRPNCDLSSVPIKSELYSSLDAQYLEVSSSSWTLLLHQCFKVCLLDPLNPEILNISDQASGLVKFGSEKSKNFYSYSETLLLAWINSLVTKYFPQMDSKISNFDTDFANCVPFVCLLLHYLPFFCTSSFSFLNEFSDLSLIDSETLNVLFRNYRKDCAGDILNILTRDLGFDLTISINDLLNPLNRNVLILLTMLAHVLPAYKKESADQSNLIEFRAKLGSVVSKQISISNSFNQPVTYRIIFHNNHSNTFSTESNLFEVGAQQSDSLRIDYNCKFSRKDQCGLYLIPLKVGLTYPQPHSFTLKSIPRMTRSAQKVDVIGSLYSLTSHDFPVQNPFDSEANLTCQVVVSSVDDLLAPNFKNFESLASSVNPFTLHRDSISLKANESTTLTIDFCPFLLGNFSGFICFSDENLGEFIIDLEGVSELPKAAASTEIRTNAGENTEFNIQIPTKNSLFESICNNNDDVEVNSLFESYSNDNEIAYFVLNNAKTATLPNAFTINKSRKVSQKSNISGLDRAKLTEGTRSIKREGSIMTDLSMRMGQNFKNFNNLTGNFRSNQCGRHDIRIVLVSKFDIRVVYLTAHVTSSATSQSSTVEFKCPLKQNCTKEITVNNDSSFDEIFDVNISNKSNFAGNSELFISKNSKSTHSITFTPSILDKQMTSSITFTGRVSRQTVKYNLLGIAEFPKPEKKLSYNVIVREPSKFSIKIPSNFTKGSLLKVKTDLDCLSGDSTVVMDSQNPQKSFDFIIRSTKIGSYSGILSLIDSQNNSNISVFEVVVEVTSPPAKDQILIESTVIESTVVSLLIYNPLAVDVLFDVVLNGPGLRGKQSFLIEKGSNYNYEFYFEPYMTNISNTASGFVKFLPHDHRLEESWYELLLSVVPSNPTMISDVTCEVGSQKLIKLPVLNPSTENLELSVSVDDTLNFSKPSGFVQIAGNSTMDVSIVFVPSNFSNFSTMVTITSIEYPSLVWQFEVLAEGLKPTVNDPLVIPSCLGKTSSEILTFRNPFNYNIQVQISAFEGDLFSGDQPKESDENFVFGNFQLRIKNSIVYVEKFGVLHLPIDFTAIDNCKYLGTVVIECCNNDDKVQWNFPVIGQSYLIDCNPCIRTVSAELRSKFEQNLEFFFSKLSMDSTFSLKLDSNFNSKWVNLPSKTTSKRFKASIPITFSPTRSLSSTANIVFTNDSTGGQWIFPIKFIGDGSNVSDGEIVLNSKSLNIPVSFDLKLTNVVNQEESFEVFVKASEFSVSPMSGTLPPLSLRQSIVLEITFTPTHSKVINSILVIRSSSFEWRYQLIGNPPSYEIPTGTPTFSSRLDYKHLNALKKAQKPKNRNFIKSNIARLGLK